jgi:hypothetical protein
VPKFQPGQSGNPAGRPVNPVKMLARENSRVAFEQILTLMRSDDPRIAFAAAQEVLNRGWGKPAQAIVGDDDEAPVQVAIRRFYQP